MKLKKFTILRDNKEKVGYWNLSFASHFGKEEVVHLKTGDYTLKGFEDLICIERKKTTGEIAINLGQKYKQFEAEMVRMSTIKYKYIICEFSIENLMEFPVNSGVPKYLWKYLRLSGQFMLSRINTLSESYGVEFIFAGCKTNAEQKAMELFTSVFIET